MGAKRGGKGPMKYLGGELTGLGHQVGLGLELGGEKKMVGPLPTTPFSSLGHWEGRGGIY